MREDVETIANVRDTCKRHISTLPQQEIRIEDLLFSETVSAICYWATILLLAFLGAYLIRFEVSHAERYIIAPNDFWGIATPPWLVAPLAPLGTVLSLGHAVWSAIHRRREWRFVLTAFGLLFVLAAGRWLQPSL